MNNNTPVNKQASMFLSRKRRVETIKEALDIFTTKLSEPEVANACAEMLSDKDSRHTLSITVLIHRDEATPGRFACKMRGQLRREISEDHFFGLAIQ